MLTEDEKLQLQFKFQLIRICAGIKSPNRKRNFSKPKWVKLGTLLKIPEPKLKKKSLGTARGLKENLK